MIASPIALLCVFVCGAPSSMGAARLADTGSGMVKGTVVDARGEAIGRVTILLRDGLGQSVQVTRTNDKGLFSFERVVAGEYSIFVEASGYEQAEPVRLTVAAGTSEVREIKLRFTARSNWSVVSPTRNESDLKSTAATTTVISNSELANANSSQLLDVLRSVPGFVVLQQGRAGALAVVFSRGGSFGYNKVLLDGVPLNNDGGFYNFAFLTTENIDRIEVVKGAQSALFGSDAMSGVIQLISKRGVSNIPEVELIAEGGSFGFNRQSLRLSGIYRRFDYSGALASLSTDGIVENDDFRSRTVSANLGGNLSARSLFRATIRLNASRAGFPGSLGRFLADPTAREKDRSSTLSSRLKHQTSRTWENSIGFVYNFENLSTFDVLGDKISAGDTFRPIAANIEIAGSQNHQRKRGLHYQSIGLPEKKHGLTAGFDWEREDATFDAFDRFSAIRIAASRDTYAFYAQDQFSLYDRVFVSGGFRADHNRGKVPAGLVSILRDLGSAVKGATGGFGTKISPKISVRVIAHSNHTSHLLGSTNIKLNFGTGIKEPRFIESFFPQDFPVPNPSLKPERALSYEIGMEQALVKDRVLLEVTYFDNRFRNLVTFVVTPSFDAPDGTVFIPGPVRLADGSLTNFINADEASAKGVEVTATARPTRRLRLFGSYTYLKSRLDKAQDIFDFSRFAIVPNPEVGLALRDQPAHSGGLGVDYTGNRVQVSLSGVFLGRRRTFDAENPFSVFDSKGRPFFAEKFAKVDFTMSLPLTHHLTAIARIDNLLNQRYEEFLHFPSYKLHFSTGLRFTFGALD